MNNKWNQIIYKAWSPFYDRFFNKGMFLKARKEVFKDIEFINGEKVLFVGCGTGADLVYVPYNNIKITAIDYSSDMLDKAKEKFPHINITFLQMDAQNLTFPDETYDIVIASLLLSVVPNPQKCMEEMIRVVKPKGRIIIFDKFIPKNEELSPIKKAVRPLISMLGTDIGINFEKLSEPFVKQLSIQTDIPIMLNGMYRKIISMKIPDARE
ncbi:class I SAM-dependent methyltransferase [Cytobacillus solani]|uniref:Phosphatidylethanolamine N-methyltransferase n=1 Tax=Cytobacillus solani TaxID=1637975 RepID=A0A0Q3VFR0_9BACI|nr:class I SAM-dependent methyltransferase [Cytobacillus solani]KOP71001.1 phosphatidylethanolamine N-methyltransferase [Bacillus sp. FJAT-21945]KQL18050.1 phosphatidylethanolamine N-methyltransferase [Cytobacillus solani]USK55879.1 class I SAM-dependent methyltransferase [Cytobacillus solani]